MSSNATERLDFLQGRGGEEGDNDKGSQYKSEVWGVEGKGSLDISLKVRSLTVTFNKPEHPLAQGMVSELVAKVETRHGNLQLSGRLGQASVVDLTETGAYYRERWGTYVIQTWFAAADVQISLIQRKGNPQKPSTSQILAAIFGFNGAISVW